MTVDDVVHFARAHLSDEGLRLFSDRALWAASESQKATAIPALVLVASSSLLVVVLWIALVAAMVRWVRSRIPQSP